MAFGVGRGGEAPLGGETVFRLQVYVVVNSLSQVIFVFLLFLGMVIHANKVEAEEK